MKYKIFPLSLALSLALSLSPPAGVFALSAPLIDPIPSSVDADTYTQLFDLIRQVFTLLPQAKIRGYKSQF